MYIATLAAPLLLAISAVAADAPTATDGTTVKPIGSAGSEYKFGWWMDIESRQAMALWENSCWKLKEARNAQRTVHGTNQREGFSAGTEADGTVTEEPEEREWTVISHEITASGERPQDKLVHCTCLLRDPTGVEKDVTKQVASMLGWQATASLKTEEIANWHWTKPFSLNLMRGRQ